MSGVGSTEPHQERRRRLCRRREREGVGSTEPPQERRRRLCRRREREGLGSTESPQERRRRLSVVERIRLALRAHLRVIAEQLDVATVFVREWRYLEPERREEFVAERRRYEERIRALFREGVEQSELRTDLDVEGAALLFLSAANWAYTWLQPGRDTDELADRFYALLL